ncbi:MAG: hypothetical protein Q8N17_16665 [Burkholderiaceae bacterium]|nr:hypothetical protein [Burkholderiaceae bacterium]
MRSDSLELQEFSQLFNSSYATFFSYLLNDFFTLTYAREIKSYFFKYSMITRFFLKLKSTDQDPSFFIIPTIYYERLIKFYWTYFEPKFLQFMFFFYGFADVLRSVKFKMLLSDHASAVWYTFFWSLLAVLETTLNKAFLFTNEFEDFYDTNFDKGIERLNKFNSMFNRKTKLTKIKIKKNKKIRDELNMNYTAPQWIVDSSRFSDYQEKLSLYKHKQQLSQISSFFTTSFSF